ncbi:MAG: 30S ribosome-binding factor RbfA [Legionellales bacterium]|nr:30S ribosome-binding factor RbfA [Legionellales bacterium]
MPKDFERTRRVADVIQRELALIIQREMRDPRLGLVTISVIKLSKDLKHAKVFFTTLNDSVPYKEQATILNAAKKQLRYELSRLLELRVVPELLFIYDESIARGNYMSQIINKAIHQDEKKHKE